MATKTISIDMEAYERLAAARLEDKESFSRVIKRAIWRDQGKTCGALLDALPLAELVEDDVLDRLEQAQQADLTPDNPWE